MDSSVPVLIEGRGIEGVPVEGVSGAKCWTLKAGSWLRQKRSIVELKREVIEMACAMRHVWISYSEDPRADELPGEWQPLAAHTWTPPRNVDVDVLLHWLRLGGWVLFAGTEPPVGPTDFDGDPFSPNDLAAAGIGAGADIILSAFHDNDPWRIVSLK